jgi:predicted HTH transcriptional regulator
MHRAGMTMKKTTPVPKYPVPAGFSRFFLVSTTDLPALSRIILKIVKSREQTTVSDLVKLSEANRNTIKKHLKSLVEARLIKKHGVKKGSRYSQA